ncbi:E3 ubiquitin-protein ligase RMA1H1 isoform X2 [Manihot esculenta]|uniref:E3 ubiquitin-protein ligase RMA n=2 Tax=Manihot esculenta TaxID=3983 RepID=A0A251IXF7_MANES|nr:E3 ubiquitin-protein ligase RMA1H1 isoform X2 [Manihot esculenta]XP_021597872.1 E3 ubiquitin-protein ligase RMA1H1 isoform X2 [Manihot esculenta]XP_021597874.1 E3 ubiquitin-protein ligase RMA1H1 isoform X2 [Manihot esculenta]XP_021597876.1 E3 ubiquitin-protein ligase RMA1H1 isoform X2 [Manihot esculenta]XP_021597877.1 E3 ubiquitin-protein ligase RMA1H1 isoform X2 [Manihot esculenta]XP_043807910.1 E3 ubiquitin-protein ligase RMA1H1 isoform X2 [Manihot esculenta]XP_043807911.1 E3 ubiquitin-p
MDAFWFLIKSQRSRAYVQTSFKSRSMELEQYFAQEWKSVASAATGSESIGGCFDCNICFDFAQEPVVTLCGHLYCWPCIYKWLHVQSASLASDEHPQCPVCKADISHTTMVPLYGRGQSLAEADLEGKAPCRGMVIPPRPSAYGAQALVSSTPQNGQQLPYRNPYQNHNFNPDPYSSFEEASSSPLLNLGGSPVTGVHHPFVGMFGELVYARVFGNSESLYTYPNSYHLMGSASPRLRRQEMQADKSLNRISIFLFCCFLLCLIVF